MVSYREFQCLDDREDAEACPTLPISGPAIGFGVAKEFRDYYAVGDRDDSLGDLQANFDGQRKAWRIWKGCAELCDGCSF